MADKLADILKNLTDNYQVIVFIVSMIPMIELKGAIPIGIKLGELSLWKTSLIAYLGSTLIFVPIFFLLIPIFNLIKKISIFKKLVEKIEGVFYHRAQKIAIKTNGSTEDKAKRIMRWSLFAFVAVPFPVTGIWTGTAIAVFLGMKFKDSFLPIAVGNFVAGSLITLMTWLFKDYVDIIIYILFAIAIVMFVFFVIKIVISKPKQNQ